MAKYHEISTELIKEIVDGKYSERGKLPTEKELSLYFDASRNTIRSAINLLTDEGYVYKVQGSGIYLRPINFDESTNLNLIKGFSSEHLEETSTIKILSLETVAATAEIAAELNCTVGEQLYYLRRVRFVDNEPVRVERSYYRQEIVPYLGQEIAHGSIYNYLTKTLKLQIGFADRKIQADYLSKENAELLGLAENDPALIVNEKIYLSNGQIVILGEGILHFQKISLFSSAKNYD
ncbi:GntR family transcriptional regulator [Enterococcus sp. BWR-S5]|uniref:GntR family transcriptional regulator n=1 Tax=Enterococcus sp. BWR-S5 TaxID=2787714 RepID=UPI001924A548|nr:GntR family transcriptional regulator [Enterococcus sp. BWR-S5]MBL1227318.1 GntR family transcriptional regulator [Enterococcus sp. BWR-S5]